MKRIAALLVLTALLSGCGSDESGDPIPGPEPGSDAQSGPAIADETSASETVTSAATSAETETETPAVAGFFSVVEAESTEANMGYLQHLPRGYETEPQPLLLVLHGWGGVASPMEAHLEFMSDKDWPEDLPFVVLAPLDQTGPTFGFVDEWCSGFDATCVSQAQHDHAGEDGTNRCFAPSELSDFIDFALASFDVDPDRVYLTGESCGGYAIFDYLGVHGASQVAAAVPIAGDGRPAFNDVGCKLWSVPVWAFHSRGDPEVPLAGSEEPITAAEECASGSPARLTVVDGTEHLLGRGVWTGDLGYDVPRWLLRQRRP